MRLSSALTLPVCVASALALSLLTGACNLNPQPLPPGETADGAPTNAAVDGGESADDATTGSFGGADAGSADATAPPVTADGGDASAPGDAGLGAADGGDGGDAGDAAAEDAPSDAPHDAAEDGG